MPGFSWRRLAALGGYVAAAGVGLAVVDESLDEPPEPVVAGAVAGASASFDTVRRGETLELIALRTGTTVMELLRLNEALSALALHPGKKIRIR